MHRNKFLLDGLTRDMKGLEIAPWHKPLAPKREGYNCLVLDVFDTDALRQRAKEDPLISAEGEARIEEVDFVGSATEIAEIVLASQDPNSFDYVLSSHNFEHLPNPLKFLKGVEALLKPGGVLVMALPDHRYCFDHFRFPTQLTEWLEAETEDRRQPTPSQVFSQTAYGGRYFRSGATVSSFSSVDDPRTFSVLPELKRAHETFRDAMAGGNDLPYTDVHCWRLTPSSFELLMLESNFLGLTGLGLEAVSQPRGTEFRVRLRNPAAPRRIDPETFERERNRLLHAVRDEEAKASPWGWRQLLTNRLIPSRKLRRKLTR